MTNEEKPKQPAVLGGPCDGGDGYAACNLVLTYECTQCGRREAADDSAKAPDEQETRSLERVGRLCARWREDATAMLEIAEDAPTDSQEQLECYERMRTLRDCADGLERELAGTEPTVRMSEGEP